MHPRSVLLWQVERDVLHPSVSISSAEPTLPSLIASNTHYHTGLPGSLGKTVYMLRKGLISLCQEPLAPS